MFNLGKHFEESHTFEKNRFIIKCNIRCHDEEQWTTGGREGLGSVLLLMKSYEVHQFSMMMTRLWGTWDLGTEGPNFECDFNHIILWVYGEGT